MSLLVMISLTLFLTGFHEANHSEINSRATIPAAVWKWYWGLSSDGKALLWHWLAYEIDRVGSVAAVQPLTLAQVISDEYNPVDKAIITAYLSQLPSNKEIFLDFYHALIVARDPWWFGGEGLLLGAKYGKLIILRHLATRSSTRLERQRVQRNQDFFHDVRLERVQMSECE